MQQRDIAVLVLDYPGPISAGRVRSLKLEQSTSSVTYLLDEIRPCEVDAGRYVFRLAEWIGRSKPVDLILAYCASSAIARELASVIADSGRGQPWVCLINPEDAEREDAAEVARSTLTEIGVSASEIEKILGSGDAGSAANILLHEYERALLGAYLREIDTGVMSPDIAFELARQQIEWVAHICAAGTAYRSSVRTNEVHITSMGHECGRNCDARHIRIDVNADSLFGSDILREHVSKLIREAKVRLEPL